MLGLDEYGSGSESGSDGETLNCKPASITSKSKFSLPPPSSNGSTSELPLPPPKSTKRAPKKIAIGLPAISKKEDEGEEDMRPAAKRQKTGGAGASALLSMLPAPKQNPMVLPQPNRVLGGGKGPGLVFNERSSATSAQPDGEEDENIPQPTLQEPAASVPASGVSLLPFLPPSLVKGKANISLEDKPNAPVKQLLSNVSAPSTTDFFSLGNSKASVSSASTTNSLFSLTPSSSAPAVPTFEPPEPTPQDLYPGYYQLPSGQWTAYEPIYYEKFRKKWQSEYDAYVRGLEKGTLKGFEGYEDAASEVDAAKEMEKAKVEIKEREERKALTKGATGPKEEPKMKFNASKLSGIARSRHQLSTLLRDAYENREMLEEQIAEGRRNRKEAGNKYGF